MSLHLPQGCFDEITKNWKLFKVYVVILLKIISKRMNLKYKEGILFSKWIPNTLSVLMLFEIDQPVMCINELTLSSYKPGAFSLEEGFDHKI